MVSTQTATNAGPGNARSVAETLVTAGTLIVFADAAFETFRAGSRERWWVVAGAALLGAATAATWRRVVGWRIRLALGVLSLLALIAITAWMPGGLTNGIRIFAQPTARILSALAAVGVALAGVAVFQLTTIPLGGRVAAAAVAAYAIVAFSIGSASGVPLSALLTGASLWQRLPVFLQGAFLGGLVVLPIGLVAAIVRAGLRRPPEAS